MYPPHPSAGDRLWVVQLNRVFIHHINRGMTEHHTFSPDGRRQLAKDHLPLDRRRWNIPRVTSEGGERRALGGVPREQKMLKRHPPRVTYHQVY